MLHCLYEFPKTRAVLNMTVGEVSRAVSHGSYKVIMVASHKTSATHGAAKQTILGQIYQVLTDFMGINKEGSDLVFVTSTGQKIKNLSSESEKLTEAFGKKFEASMHTYT